MIQFCTEYRCENYFIVIPLYYFLKFNPKIKLFIIPGFFHQAKWDSLKLMKRVILKCFSECYLF